MHQEAPGAPPAQLRADRASRPPVSTCLTRETILFIIKWIVLKAWNCRTPDAIAPHSCEPLCPFGIHEFMATSHLTPVTSLYCFAKQIHPEKLLTSEQTSSSTKFRKVSGRTHLGEVVSRHLRRADSLHTSKRSSAILRSSTSLQHCDGASHSHTLRRLYGGRTVGRATLHSGPCNCEGLVVASRRARRRCDAASLRSRRRCTCSAHSTSRKVSGALYFDKACSLYWHVV